MTRLHFEPPVQALITPVIELLETAAAALPLSGTLTVDLGAVDGFGAFESGRWVLSEGLAGPAMFHPDEIEGLEMDRWRRAMATVLEGLAWAGLAAEFGVPKDEAGWWCGAAVALADLAAPDLALGPITHVSALVSGDLRGRNSALLFDGPRPLGRVAAWSAEAPNADTLLRALTDALRPAGPRARLPLPVALPEVQATPIDLHAWQFARLAAAGAGGALVGSSVAGPEVVGPTPSLVVATAPTTASLAQPKVVGGWDLASTAIPSTILGARGVTLRFYTSGRVDLLFADAFVGPLEALEIAKTMGHSGMTSGTWFVEARDVVRFGAIRVVPITMHQRDGSQPMPQVGMGVTEWVAALAHTSWTVERTGDELLMTGRLMDMPVRLRLRPEVG